MNTKREWQNLQNVELSEELRETLLKSGVTEQGLMRSNSYGTQHYALLSDLLESEFNSQPHQFPLSIPRVEKLAKDIAKTNTLHKSVELAYVKDVNVAMEELSEREILITDINEAFVCGGRHRTAALKLIATALDMPLEDFRVKVLLRVFSTYGEATEYVVADNGSRSISVVEKKNMEIAGKVDIEDVEAVMSFLGEARLSSEVTKLYVAYLVHVLADKYPKYKRTTLGRIVGSVLRECKKQKAYKAKELKTQKAFKEICQMLHANLADVVEELGVTNLGRNVREISAELVHRHLNER